MNNQELRFTFYADSETEVSGVPALKNKNTLVFDLALRQMFF